LDIHLPLHKQSDPQKIEQVSTLVSLLSHPSYVEDFLDNSISPGISQVPYFALIPGWLGGSRDCPPIFEKHFCKSKSNEAHNEVILVVIVGGTLT
jgi:hypothetical protein